MKKSAVIIIGLLLAAFLAGEYLCARMALEKCGTVTSDTIREVRVDTLWRTDTVPVYVSERVTGRIALPVHGLSDCNAVTDSQSAKDSVILPIVQREYRDSSYVAWVSGPKADSIGPRLDSIRVMERRVTESVLVTKTITKPAPRISFGLTGGYGIGLQTGRIEPFVGIGITVRLRR